MLKIFYIFIFVLYLCDIIIYYITFKNILVLVAEIKIKNKNIGIYTTMDKSIQTNIDAPKLNTQIDSLLPPEVDTSWFEVMPEPIKVRNRHLTNVTKPIGGTPMYYFTKNTYDNNKNPPIGPKFVVSPWMQSSVEHDTNIKGSY